MIAGAALRSKVWVPATMSCVAFMVAVFHNETSSYLQYQSDFDQSGEAWRLITAHFVHLDWWHLLLNLAGLWLLWLLVGGMFGADQWLLVIVLLSLSITAGLKIWSPEVDWYVGLSGLIYGMLAAGLVAGIHTVKSPLALLFALLLLKAVLDSLYGPLSLINLTEHRVVADGHSYGIAAGTVFGLIGRLIGRPGR